MKKLLENWHKFLTEAEDYFQETFNIIALVSVAKNIGGSREQVKVDIRAIPEVLTVAPVEPPRGIQRDVGDKIITTLKIHCRQPDREVADRVSARSILQDVQRIPGVTIIR